jgi:hypothetical protein
MIRTHALPAISKHWCPRAFGRLEIIVMRLVLLFFAVAQYLHPFRIFHRPVEQRGDARLDPRAQGRLAALEEHARAGAYLADARFIAIGHGGAFEP